MSQPVIIVVKQDANLNQTILRVDVAYVPSFCQHLTMRGIKFIRSEVQNEDWGLNRDGSRWEIVANEIAVQGIPDFENWLAGWEIPQVGL